MKSTKKALLLSMMSMLLCVAMLMGTTFAWFTDSVISGVNKIVAGNLDVDMLYKSGNMTEYKTVNGVTNTADGSTPFFVDKDGGKILWEPGVMVYTYFDVENLGTLALQYNFALRITGKNALETDGNKHSLDEVIKAVVLEGEIAGDQVKSSVQGKEWESIESFTHAASLQPNGSKKFTVVLYWAPTANDDLYNVKNGQVTTDVGAWENHNTEALYIDFDIKLTATQLDHENDSFGNTYDKFADLWKLSTVTPDGRWVGITKGEQCILDGTTAPYITVVGADGQPGEIIALTNGLDKSVGNGNITVSGNNVTYTNTGAAQNVVIHTNSFETKLTVNGTTDDTVVHYGYAGLVEVKKVAMASYDEFGTVGRLFATSEGATGHIDIKAGATVYQVEQLGGTATKVSVDANATVYDINQNKVEGAVVGTTERFTETITETHTDDERVTAVECNHPKTEDVIDGQHVYEVCKKCGYTVIKVDGIKKTVADEQSENVIVPKASYDGSQVTAGAENGDVQINKNEDGSYVTPSVATTPVIDTTNTKAASCEHIWTHSHDGEKCIKSCSKCGLSYADEHRYYDSSKNNFYATCPECGVALGTEEIPYQITNAQEFVMINRFVNDFTKRAINFKLVNDIDISDTSKLAKLKLSGSPLDYIYYFQGTFDGNGHKVYCGNKRVFQYNVKDMTIKNTTFVEKCVDDNFILLVYPNAYAAPYNGTITFENVNVIGENEETLYTCSNVYWVAAALNSGNMIFKNCNSYIDYATTDDYTGIFFGSYIVAGASVSYINCHNYGNVYGTNLGLFNGNGNGKYLEQLSYPEAKPSSDKSGVYIQNCSNEGKINATVSYSPFSTYAPSNALTSINSMNELIIEKNLFTPGEVSVGGIDLTLTKDGSSVKINEVDSAKIANYKVTVYVGCGGKNDEGESWGSSYFKVSFEFAKDAPQKSLSFIKAFVMSDTYSIAYDQIQSEEKETEEGILYKEVVDESGITIVINTESAIADVAASLNSSHIASVTCGSAPSYRIDAYDTNGINLGSKTYSVSELPN